MRAPVLAYNFPLHGGVELAAATLGRIAAHCDNLVGVKDSSGKLDLALAYKNASRERDLAVFVGFDNLVLAALEQGCAERNSFCTVRQRQRRTLCDTGMVPQTNRIESEFRLR